MAVDQPRPRARSRWARALGVVALGAVIVGGAAAISSPGESYRGPLPALTSAEHELTAMLRRDVETLSRDIGERNLQHPQQLEAAAKHIEDAFTAAGYTPRRHTFAAAGKDCHNLEVEIKAGPEIVVVGAHYDSAPGTPGANDNATGTAALLALARMLRHEKPRHTLRLVAFTNEEPPYFQTADMGSLRYALEARDSSQQIRAMLSLETMGYYSDVEGSQKYPWPIGMLYPATGDFIGFVSDLSSRALLRDVVGSFRGHTQFPSESAALPAAIEGVGWSDHWSFWQAGYPAVMVTDTAVFRYPHYHTAQDTPDKVDYERLARVVAGLHRVVQQLVR